MNPRRALFRAIDRLYMGWQNVGKSFGFIGAEEPGVRLEAADEAASADHVGANDADGPTGAAHPRLVFEGDAGSGWSGLRLRLPSGCGFRHAVRGMFSRGAVLSCDGPTDAIVDFLERELERQGLTPVERSARGAVVTLDAPGVRVKVTDAGDAGFFLGVVQRRD